MRIAYLIEQFNPQRGGMERSSAEFLAELRRLGLQPEVISQSAPGSATTSGMTVHQVPAHGWGRGQRYRRFVDAAAVLLERSRWDIVHAVTPCHRCDVYVPRSGVVGPALEQTIAARSSPVLRLLRQWSAQFNGKQRLLAHLERELLTRRRPRAVVAISQYMRLQLQSHYGLAPDAVHDVFNGVTVPPPQDGERAAARIQIRAEWNLMDNPVALFAGHNFRRKGLKFLIEALAQPGAQSWHVIVAGKDSITSYQRLARNLNLLNRVHFAGHRADIRVLYLAADACVLPTWYDPCSRTVLEALSLGVPAVTTRFDGSADVIQEGQNGFVLAAPTDVHALGRALASLNDAPRRQEMSRHALSLRPRLSMQRHAREIAEIYQQLVRRGPDPAA